MAESGEAKAKSYPGKETITAILENATNDDRKVLPGISIHDLHYIWPEATNLTDSQEEAIRTRLNDQMRMIPKDSFARLADFILRPTLRRTEVDLTAMETSAEGIRTDNPDEALFLAERNIKGKIVIRNREVIFGSEDSIIYLKYRGIPVDPRLPGLAPLRHFSFLKRDGRILEQWFEGEGALPLIEKVEEPKEQLRTLLESLGLFDWTGENEAI